MVFGLLPCLASRDVKFAPSSLGSLFVPGFFVGCATRVSLTAFFFCQPSEKCTAAELDDLNDIAYMKGLGERKIPDAELAADHVEANGSADEHHREHAALSRQLHPSPFRGGVHPASTPIRLQSS